jgi:hypothetical protein
MNTIKILVIAVFSAITSNPANAQAPVYEPMVQFAYDAAGNRFQRQIIQICVLNCAAGGLTAANNTAPQAVDIKSRSTQTVYEDPYFATGVKIYPNPVSSTVTIELPSLPPDTPTMLYLYDTQGKLVETRTLISTTNTVNMSAFAAGLYIARLVQGDAVSDWKLAKY